MKLFFTRTVVALLAIISNQATIAQTTYTITSNQNWSTVVTSSYCTKCTFNINSGVTLTIGSYGQCTNCTFNGGTVNFTDAGFGLYSGNLFENETLLLNAAESPQGNSFTNDTIAINAGSTFGSGTSTFTNSRISVNAATTCQSCVFTNDSVHVTSGEFTWQSSSITISGSHFDLTGTAYISNQVGMTLTNSTFSLSNSAYYNMDGGTTTVSGSQIYLNNNAYITASSTFILEKSSELFVGDGTVGSKAYLYANVSTPPSIVDNSLIKIANNNNYYNSSYNINYYVTSTSGTPTSINTQNSTINCGGTYPNSCSTGEIFGCATINSGGVVPCDVLAIADIILSALPSASAGDDAVALSWSDGQSATANHYLVQRSTGTDSWTTIATIEAGGYTAGYTTGDYRFTDAAAPAGTDNYRIARVDQYGAMVYSAISSVTIAGATAGIGIFPNPATGHTFYLKVPVTEELTVSVFTVTGQLLSRRSLQGQLQYQLSLPPQLLPGNVVIVQAIGAGGSKAFPLLIR